MPGQRRQPIEQQQFLLWYAKVDYNVTGMCPGVAGSGAERSAIVLAAANCKCQCSALRRRYWCHYQSADADDGAADRGTVINETVARFAGGKRMSECSFSSSGGLALPIGFWSSRGKVNGKQR